jgi:hypothetical protein
MENEPVLTIQPWSDAVIDRVGHDPRSVYVEQFWLGVLGPSTTWFLRLLAHRLDREPEGFDLDLRATARTLGLGPPHGRGSPLQRSVDRTVRFGLARTVGQDGLDVRRRLPPLNRFQLARLPASLQQAHREWQEQVLGRDRFEETQRRARRLALSLFEVGEDPDGVERQLHRWKYHPALASAATVWALDRHRQALAATT